MIITLFCWMFVHFFLFHLFFFFFFFNAPATTEIYTLSLHDALPICDGITGATVFSREKVFNSASNFNLMLPSRSEEHTSELQSRLHLVCRLLLEKKKKKKNKQNITTHNTTQHTINHYSSQSQIPILI